MKYLLPLLVQLSKLHCQQVSASPKWLNILKSNTNLFSKELEEIKRKQVKVCCLYLR